MSPQLDDELERLRRADLGCDLGQLESAVWQRIATKRERRSSSAVLLPVGVLSVFAALGIGLAGGGLAAAASQEHEVSAFSIDQRLAPSTLLDGHQ